MTQNPIVGCICRSGHIAKIIVQGRVRKPLLKIGIAKQMTRVPLASEASQCRSDVGERAMIESSISSPFLESH